MLERHAVRLIGDSITPVGVSAVIDWQPVRAAPRLSPGDSWDCLQHPYDPRREEPLEWRMDGSNHFARVTAAHKQHEVLKEIPLLPVQVFISTTGGRRQGGSNILIRNNVMAHWPVRSWIPVLTAKSWSFKGVSIQLYSNVQPGKRHMKPCSPGNQPCQLMPKS